MAVDKVIRLAPLVIFLLVIGVSPASAQSASTGVIAGVARDSSGGVLPGVTVEAASPALIEKVRTALTDDQGNYKIVELVPGTYSVTFTLPGFGTFKREGIELNAGFTASVNGEMKVGGLEETVTVSGQSPLVDVQNTRTTKVLTAEVLNTLPTFKSTGGFLAVTLGSSNAGAQDVGGNKGESVATMSIHGSATGDLRWKLDGMNWTTNLGSGSTRTHRQNTVAISEVVVEAGGTAENETGGAQLNYIPRDGGNVFSAFGSANYTNEHLQASNLTDELRARGLNETPGIQRIWEYGIGVGGPIVKDKLWFYQSNRWWGGEEYQPGAYFNANVNGLFYVADTSRKVAATGNWAKDFGARGTWQVTPKHKVTFSDNIQRNCNCISLGATTSVLSPEASTNSDNFWNQVAQATWNYPASNRLLFTAGMSYGHFPQNSHLTFGTTPQTIGIQNLTTGKVYNARNTINGVTDYGEGRRRDTIVEQFTASYVTGSHAFKGGFLISQGRDDENSYIPNDLTYQFRDTAGVTAPASIIEWASPIVHNTRVLNTGFYAQDQWTIRKLTLNYGLRFDMFTGKVLALNLPKPTSVNALQCEQSTTQNPCIDVQVPTGRFIVGDRNYPEVNNVPNFKDLSPRIGAAYDLFGNGRTAIKGSINRYVSGLGVGIPQSVAPALAVVVSTTRNWNDQTFGAGDPRSGNFIPDCDLQNPQLNGECATLNNTAFGTSVINTTRDDAVTTGFGTRAYNWQATAGVQHELRPGLAFSVVYYRTWFGNMTATDNTLIVPGNYDPYCITVPSDSRLPNGGQQLCGMFDQQRQFQGQVKSLITKSANFGDQTDVFNGVDVGVSARFGRGGFLAGGLAVGRETLHCAIVDSPQVAQLNNGGSSTARIGPGTCDVTPPWSSGTQVKLNGSYPLPYGLDIAAVFQNLPGIENLATYAVPNALIAPSLGRNLAACPTPTGACTSTATVNLLAPMTVFEDRLNQLDLRFSKTVNLSRYRVKGMIDLYNVFNASTVLSANQTYAPPPSTSWGTPISVLGPRLFKFGVEVTF